MVNKKRTFLQISSNFLLQGKFTEIPLREICGFSDKSVVGHTSELIGNVITPVIIKENGRNNLLNGDDSRIMDLLRSVSPNSTLLIFVVDAGEVSPDDIKLARYILGYINPLITSKNDLNTAINRLREVPELHEKKYRE